MDRPFVSTPVVCLVALVGCPGPTWQEAFDGAAHGALSGVWGTGPEDIWVVGGNTSAAEILHFDGAQWSGVQAPAGLPLLSWAYGWGTDSAIAVGLQGAVARWDGASWAALDPGTDADLWGVFGFSATDVWIVGGTVGEAEPTLLHFDGETFTPHALEPEQNTRGATALFKVWGTEGTLFALGQRGLMLRWDGSQWLAVSAGAEANQDFVSLWGTAANSMVAVGGRGNARVATWDGQAWETVAPSGFGGLNASFMDEPGVAYVGGVNGFVGTFDPDAGELSQEEALPGGDVHAMWGDGEGRIYAVGGRFSEPMSGMAWVRSGG